MSNQDEIEQRLNLELEMISINQLHELGNQAIQMGLIAGHGYRGGQYEILRQGEFILLPPNEAEQYLRDLINQASS
ncbi:hypothetical protein [Pantanalinema sp. GBBB05]|uniref:hypothetical protein n=1 Tax=Pantanalinema sp. GBBB05 TaxID=2604139 RepID=UPI001D8C3C9A|nr:hypothetical protein [Pantanalinema sp. GBBB05]